MEKSRFVTRQQASVSLFPPLTNLLDAFFVLDQQLHSGDVDVQPWALWRPLHWGVKAAVVFANADTHTYKHICRIKIKSQLAKTWICEMKFEVFQCKKRRSYLISISARLLASGESGEQLFFFFQNY